MTTYQKTFQSLALLLILSFIGSFNTTHVYAQENGGSVELNGDVVEYSVDGDIITASGNVEIYQNDTKMYCDELEFQRSTNIAKARGNVRLITENGEITGDRLVYNFKTETGQFNEARIYSHPYYGAGRKVAKTGPNKIEMEDGYISTSDFDKPEYRVASSKIEIYPGVKMVARQNKVRFGEIPFLYFPKYTQDLSDTKPKIMLTPGHDRDWGTFLLAGYRYKLNENIRGVLHADYRHRLGFGSGVDVDYNTEKYGNGLVKLYYTGERDKEVTPRRTIERFKAEMRHRWQIDKKTNFIMQYYKLSDRDFLKDYFENEFDDDSNPDTFVLITRQLPKGVVSFRAEGRVNRFESKVERLPEVRYDLSNLEIADSGFFLKNTTTYSKLTKKEPSPSEIRQNTQRIDIDSEVSYPFKLGIFELKPFAGGRHTYYSEARDQTKDDSIRGIFRTGASVQTKFYRVYDAYVDKWGMEIDRLRHIITPSVDYLYQTEPTVPNSSLDMFDSIDSQDNAHTLKLSLENKLQTKRQNKSVDLLRLIVASDFRLKEHPTGGGFDQINVDMDFKPIDWLSLYFDANYDTRKDHLKTANFDLYINGRDNIWRFGLGKRFERDVDDQITTDFNWRINQKWGLRQYNRIDVKNGVLKETELKLIRDLHAWEMEVILNDTDQDGSSILFVFRLKAFPDIGFDFGADVSERRSGSLDN